MNAVILGMHRSGTSAATRVVSLLGLSLCRPEDLLRGHVGNERGHWECAPLVAANDALLEQVSARWWCPPDSAAQIASLAEELDRAEAARTMLAASYTSEPWVWKDPRLCLTLPFWRRILPEGPPTIWVLRHPAQVATSMQSRDGITRRFGLAIWERYMTLAAEAAAGLPLWVTTYADLVHDPVGWAGQAAAFLQDNGVPARMPPDPSGIRAFVSWELATAREQLADTLTPFQRELWQVLTGAAPINVPSPDPATLALMSEVRAAFALHEPTPRAAGGTFVSSDGVRVLTTRPPDRDIAPQRVSALLLPNGGPASLSQAMALRPFLPPDGEIVTVYAGERAEDVDTPEWFVPVRRHQRLSLAQRLNVAAEVARGDILVVLAGPAVRPIAGWLPALRAALQLPDCAVASPALCPADGSEPAYGLDPSALLLDTDWVVDRRDPGTRSPFAIPAASIAAFATTRAAFMAVGGFDAGLTGAGGEDLDYCLRLWRGGWRCLAVPSSRVRMNFETLPADEIDVAANTLRIGIIHLDEASLAEQIGALSGIDCFPEALSRVTAGDAGRRRQIVGALSWYDLDTLDTCMRADPQGSLTV